MRGFFADNLADDFVALSCVMHASTVFAMVVGYGGVPTEMFLLDGLVALPLGLTAWLSIPMTFIHLVNGT